MKRAYIDTRQQKKGELDVISWDDAGNYMVLTLDEWIHMQDGYAKALITASQLREELHRRGDE